MRNPAKTQVKKYCRSSLPTTMLLHCSHVPETAGGLPSLNPECRVTDLLSSESKSETFVSNFRNYLKQTPPQRNSEAISCIFISTVWALARKVFHFLKKRHRRIYLCTSTTQIFPHLFHIYLYPVKRNSPPASPTRSSIRITYFFWTYFRQSSVTAVMMMIPSNTNCKFVSIPRIVRE